MTTAFTIFFFLFSSIEVIKRIYLLFDLCALKHEDAATLIKDYTSSVRPTGYVVSGCYASKIQRILFFLKILFRLLAQVKEETGNGIMGPFFLFSRKHPSLPGTTSLILEALLILSKNYFLLLHTFLRLFSHYLKRSSQSV